MINRPHIKVTALIGYEIRGVKSYKEILYTVPAYEDSITKLFATKEWRDIAYLLHINYDTGKLRGITLNFVNYE